MNELTNLLPQTGTLSKTGWSLPANMTEPEWQRAGALLSRVDGALNWWLGDWWAFGEHAYGNRKALVESEEWEGPAFQTCRDAAWIAARFETSRRRDVVSFNHHKEVAALPPEEADKLLDWCEDSLGKTGRLPTIKALRERVKQVKSWLAQGWTTDQLERKARLEAGFAVVASQRASSDGRPMDAALIAWADQQGLMVDIDRKTAWGNPFEMPGDGDRAAVCDKFARFYLPHKDSLIKRLPSLKGKLLVCWCHPEQCHGDHLAERANGA